MVSVDYCGCEATGVLWGRATELSCTGLACHELDSAVMAVVDGIGHVCLSCPTQHNTMMSS